MKPLNFWHHTNTYVFCMLCILLSPLANAGKLKLNDHAPDWVLSTATGESISFYEDSADNAAVVLFWATWCPFCKALMPELEALRKELADSPVKFYALNIWEDGDPAAHMQLREYGFRLMLMADGVAKHYGVKGTPGLFVIDKNKMIRYIRLRGSKPKAVVDSIREALALPTDSKDKAEETQSK